MQIINEEELNKIVEDVEERVAATRHIEEQAKLQKQREDDNLYTASQRNKSRVILDEITQRALAQAKEGKSQLDVLPLQGEDFIDRNDSGRQDLNTMLKPGSAAAIIYARCREAGFAADVTRRKQGELWLTIKW